MLELAKESAALVSGQLKIELQIVRRLPLSAGMPKSQEALLILCLLYFHGVPKLIYKTKISSRN